MSDKDDSIIINPVNEKQVCLICKPQLNLMPKDDDDSILYCPRCLRIYYPNREATAFEDEMESIHEDEQVELAGIGGGDSILMEADDNNDIIKPKTSGPRIPLKEGETLISYSGDYPE